jgi:prepilin-type N-terminal cleavage/methylation domain-containing protein
MDTSARIPVRYGFSLVELMIVLSIMGLFTLLVVTNTTFLHRSIMYAQLEQLYSICQLARQTALATNQAQTIQFDRLTNSYTWAHRKESLPRSLRFGFIPGTKGPPAHPTAQLYTPITFSGDKITFYPDGIVQSGTLYLIDEHATSMYAISNAVAQFSYLRMYRYDGTWQIL